jgi:hypothetical protein
VGFFLSVKFHQCCNFCCKYAAAHLRCSFGCIVCHPSASSFWRRRVAASANAAADALAAWLERDNNAKGAANALAAPLWQQADRAEEDLPLVQPDDRADSPQSVHNSMPGHVWYHSPFSDGTVEQTLHRRPLEERLTLMHQLRDIILTAEEEQPISI